MTFGRSRFMLPPAQIAVEHAGFWIRFVSHLADSLILGLIFYGLIWLIYALWPDQGPNVVPVMGYRPYTIDFHVVVQIVYTIIYPAALLLYHVLFWSWRGQTPGKMMLRIRVVRTDGSPLALGHAILRFIGWAIFGFTFLIGYLWIGFDSNKQGWHDKIADTYVVKLPPKRVRIASIYE